MIVFVKRRLLLPLTRWLFEYTLENFRRQHRTNLALMACLQTLAIENVRLRRELEGREPRRRAAGAAGERHLAHEAGLRRPSLRAAGDGRFGGALPCAGNAAGGESNHQVDVLTSCATDYITWKNVLPAGESRDGAVRVLRFPVARQRRLNRFREISEHVFAGRATPGEQDAWFRENGPEMPALLEYLEKHGHEYDRVLFWAFRYYHAWFGMPLVADRAVLVPTAEDDDLIRTATVLGPFFARPRSYLFLTPEERELVAAQVRGASAVVGSNRRGARSGAAIARGRDAAEARAAAGG